MRLMRVQGKADKVFEAIRNICLGHPRMTLLEAGRRGLLDAKLQHTVLYRVGSYPEVRLDSGIERN
jgi:hypothetical protein